MLPSQTDNAKTCREVKAAARAKFRARDIRPFFEHGHWWIELRHRNGDFIYFDAVDTQDGFDFEQVYGEDAASC